MLLLITGAGGVGTSTALARLAASPLAGVLECLQPWEALPPPAVPDTRWRQQATEVAVQRAVALQPSGRHLLLAGDPVAAGEVPRGRTSVLDTSHPSAEEVGREALSWCRAATAGEVPEFRQGWRRGGGGALTVHHLHAGGGGGIQPGA